MVENTDRFSPRAMECLGTIKAKGVFSFSSMYIGNIHHASNRLSCHSPRFIYFLDDSCRVAEEAVEVISNAAILRPAHSPSIVFHRMELEKKTNKLWNTPERINYILSKYEMDEELGATSVVDLDSVFVDVEVRMQKNEAKSNSARKL